MERPTHWNTSWDSERSEIMIKKQILITAHSGCMRTEPNTIASVLTAIKYDCDIIELDVCSTKDGIVILMHDNYIELLDGSIKYIDDIDFNELNRNIENVARLEEALEIIKKHNKIANLDLKNPRCLDKIVEVLKISNMGDSVIFSGCGLETANVIKKQYPYLKYLLNVEDDAASLGEVDYQQYLESTCKSLKEAGCIGINICYKACSSKLVEYAHFNKIPVYVWTVDEKIKMLEFIDMRVDSITTNNTKLLSELIS